MKAFATLSKLALFLLTCSEMPAFAHTMSSKGFTEMYYISKFPVTNFALVGIFHGQSFLLVYV